MYHNQNFIASFICVSLIHGSGYLGLFNFKEMKDEIWKDIFNYEGSYKVSNLGRVKSLKYGKERILKPGKSPRGYLTVVLCSNNILTTRTIHQLIAEAFLNHKPCGLKLVINHIDFDKHNNHVSNIEIVTHRENSNRKHLKSTSKYTGVYWNKRAKKWHSRIYISGKRKHIGYFINEIDAHIVYEKELNKLS